jgi:hypothetical protein
MRSRSVGLARLMALTGALLIAACQTDAGSTPASDPVFDAVDTTESWDTAIDDLGQPSPPSMIDGRECPPDNLATYENTGGPFLLTWCVGCHSDHLPKDQRAGAPLGIDFDTPMGIEAHLLRIFARAADANTTMPPTDAISSEERFHLGDWIACGTPGLSEAVMLSIDSTTTPPDETSPPDDGACTTDEDCQGECKGSMTGCVCVSKGQTSVCVRPCTSDADCPAPPNGQEFECGEDGTCAKS